MATQQKVITLDNLTGYNNHIKALLATINGNITTLQNDINTLGLNITRGDNALDLRIDGVQGQITALQSSVLTLSVGGYIEGAETIYAYGVEWDENNASPSLTRIGNSALHKTLPIQSKMRGGLLADDGTFTPFSNTSDWTSETRDGSLGQVMVEIPDHYIKYETEGTVHRVWLSEVPIQGYKHIPKHYISAYEATVERSTSKLCSVVNSGTDYRGGHNESGWDADAEKTLLGRPASNISLTNFLAYARNRNTINGQADTRWSCYRYDHHKNLFWLYVTEYASFHSQLAFNAAKTAEGYAQGGLGAGVTTVNQNTWNSYSGCSPFVPCGYTDSLGNSTGVVSLTHGTLGTVSVPRYRGIENPSGHISKWTVGALINVTSGSDGVSAVYTCDDAPYFSSLSTANYNFVGNEARNEGYVKSLLFGEDGEIFPKACAGEGVGSSTYITDYHWVNISQTSLRGLLLGGNAHCGTVAGLANVYTRHAPAYVLRSFGSRLCFQP